MHLLTLLLPTLSDVVLVVAFRALPFAVYAVSRRGTPWHSRLAVAVCYAGLWAALPPHHRGVILWSAAGLSYFALIVCLLHWLSHGTRAVAGLDALLLLSMQFVLFLAVPAVVLKNIAADTFLILGWELALKAHSYVLEEGSATLNLRQSLFFFLVDPTVVFVQRARISGPPQLSLIACRRIAIGILSVSLAFFLAEPLLTMIAMKRPHTNAWLGGWILLSGTVQLLTAYAKHSGVASVQIGLMRACGHIAGERYNYPLLARSPADFWNRWNIYVANWAKRYVYLPIALQSERRLRATLTTRAASQVAATLAISITFVGLGLYHDAYTWLERGHLSFRMTELFTVSAAMLLVWQGLGKLQLIHAPRGGRSELLRTSVSRSWTERLLFCVGFLLMVGSIA